MNLQKPARTSMMTNWFGARNSITRRIYRWKKNPRPILVAPNLKLSAPSQITRVDRTACACRSASWAFTIFQKAPWFSLSLSFFPAPMLASLFPSTMRERIFDAITRASRVNGIENHGNAALRACNLHARARVGARAGDIALSQLTIVLNFINKTKLGPLGPSREGARVYKFIWRPRVFIENARPEFAFSCKILRNWPDPKHFIFLFKCCTL